MKRKRFVIAILALLCIPAMAVFNEKDLGNTLSVLRYELKQEYDRLSATGTEMQALDEEQHQQMVDMIKKYNELSLMLYSQNEDYTFDMTYALKEVSREYEMFNSGRMPYDQLVGGLDAEIDRYERLLESLRRLPAPGDIPQLPDSLRRDSLMRRPPVIRERIDSLDTVSRKQAFLLDEESKDDRDACIFYAEALLNLYKEGKEQILTDSQHYESANARLKESYDYAQERYRIIQKRIFTQGQENYLEILTHPGKYIKQAIHELRTKYSRRLDGTSGVQSEWRGPVVFGFFLLVAICIGLATLLSRLAVNILMKRVKRMQTDRFRNSKSLITLLCGTALFLIAIAFVSAFTTNNFIAQASKLLLIFCWMMVAIFLSLLIRLRPVRFRYGIGLYMPAILIGFVAICLRVMFIPNTVMNILFPPILVVCMFWQASACTRFAKKTELTDEVVSYVTLVVLVITSVLSCFGYIFLSLLIIMWWLFALAIEETIIALYRIFHQVKEHRIGAKLETLRLQAEADFRKIHKGEFIRLTWLYDLVEDVILPVLAVVSLPLSVLLALKVFDLQEVFDNVYSAEFFSFTSSSGMDILKLSASMIVLALCLYFVFKYIAYFAKSMFRDIKLRNIMQNSGKTSISDDEVNLTVANNVISILVWGVFIILLFLLFNIPTGAISIVFAGLATGIGLAMRDILNNFIYGIQLMSGRLRAGDWVECDGIRGKVSSVSYQSTQIETLDGAVISFLNTALFNKNFKNLTRSNPYEFTKIVVGVKYGTDIEKARQVLVEAMKPLQGTDESGLKIVDEKLGVYVTVEEFGDNSVNIAVKQFVLVPQRNSYLARAREVIYKALNEAGIEIPFPQRDIHIINS
ncbi:MAG: mechanosensitive ion channel [Bacteroidales bacterium]|nr:mechanosensitive ion channel [Bacteroidales bacterium]